VNNTKQDSSDYQLSLPPD